MPPDHEAVPPVLEQRGPTAASLSGMYFEDLSPGLVFRSEPVAVTSRQIKTFAAEFDPQPFHLDEAAAESSFFGGLAASGWHTAALTMSQLVRTLPIAGGLIGAGIDRLQWLLPLRPDDAIHIEVQVLAVRVSQSRPDRGILKTQVTTLNQSGAAIQVMVSSCFVPCRTPPRENSEQL
jgi:acyl dehydratase